MAEAFLQLSPEDRRVALAFAADASGRAGSATLFNVGWSTGRFGSALDFAGLNSSGTVPDSAFLDFTTGLTIEAWVYVDGFGGNRNAIVKNGVYILPVHPRSFWPLREAVVDIAGRKIRRSGSTHDQMWQQVQQDCGGILTFCSDKLDEISRHFILNSLALILTEARPICGRNPKPIIQLISNAGVLCFLIGQFMGPEAPLNHSSDLHLIHPAVRLTNPRIDIGMGQTALFHQDVPSTA